MSYRTSENPTLQEAHEEVARLLRAEAQFVNALDLHKARIRQLQEALCECQQREIFQADLHDETCPVYVATHPRSTDEDMENASWWISHDGKSKVRLAPDLRDDDYEPPEVDDWRPGDYR